MLAEYAPLSSAIISNKQEIKTFAEVLPHLLLQTLEISKDWKVKERFKSTEDELRPVTKNGRAVSIFMGFEFSRQQRKSRREVNLCNPE